MIKIAKNFIRSIFISKYKQTNSVSNPQSSKRQRIENSSEKNNFSILCDMTDENI